MIKFNKHLLFILLTLTLTACDSSNDSGPDLDGDGIEDSVDTDIDGDGVANELDAFPLDASESVDTDGDGIGDNADSDIDGDGVTNELDAFPLDASESVDTDADGIGDNADETLNLVSNINNGPLNSVHSWVYSLDGKFAYLGTYQGLLINTLDDNGSFTSNSKLITAADLGINFNIAYTRHLEFSSKGFLYWAGSVLSEDNIDDTQNDGFIAKLTLEQNSGEISASQFIRLTSVTETLSPGRPEMFVLSPDEDKLYTSVHYGDLDNTILTFDLDSATGDLTSLNQFSLGTSDYPSYDHYMAISSNGSFLYYGLNTFLSDTAPLLIIKLNEENKTPDSFTTQEIEVTYNYDLDNTGLVIKSLLSGKLVIATVSNLGIYSYSPIDGTLSAESVSYFDKPTSVPYSISISEDLAYIALVRSEYRDNRNSNQLNVFTMDSRNNLELVDTEEGLGYSIDLRFNKDLISAIGLYNDDIFEYSLLNKTLSVITPFNSFNTDNASVVSIEDDTLSLVNSADEFVRISTADTPTVTFKEKLDTLEIVRPDALITFPNKILQFSYQYDSEVNKYRAEYLIAHILDSGELIQVPNSLYTNGAILYSAYSIGEYIVTLERTADYDYFIGLHELNNNQLEFIETSMSLDRDTFLTYFYGGMTPTNDGILLGDDEYIVVDEQLVLNTDYTGLSYNDIELIGGSINVGFSEQMLIVANAAGDELSNTVLDTFDYAHKLDDERILLVSNVTSDNFDFAIYHFNADGSFEMQSQGDYQVTAPDDSTVSVELSDTGNTAWLLVNGGYYDIGYLNIEL
jgi:hypothetical protein